MGFIVNCSVCGIDIGYKQPNGRPPICKDCSRVKNRESAAKWKDRNPERNREINRKACRKYSGIEPHRIIKPQRGVTVYYIDGGLPDHYTKHAFENLKQTGLIKSGFKPGDCYVVDGVEHRI